MRKILVVDDDADVLNICQHLLSAHGYRVICAASATEALRYVRAERPALVLLDLAMPGVSGLAAARAIRSEPWGRSLPIIAVSALGDTAAAEALAAGCNEFCVKPVAPRDLLRVIDRILGQADAGEGRGNP